MEHLDVLAHTRGGDAAAAEDVDGVVGDLVRRTRREHLEQRNGTRQVRILLRGGHVAHLVGYGFEVRLDGFGVGDHFGESIRNEKKRKKEPR